MYALLFLIIMSTIALGVYLLIQKRPRPAVEPSFPISNNQFKEEFAMEKETKITKKAKSSEDEKIERVAAAKFEEEIGEELSPLKNQIQTIQDALNQLNSQDQSSKTSVPGNDYQQANELLQQLQQFSQQAQQQQQKTFQQLQQSIHQAAQMLRNVEQSLQSVNMLNQIAEQINQSQQQLQQQNYQGQTEQSNSTNQMYQQ